MTPDLTLIPYIQRPRRFPIVHTALAISIVVLAGILTERATEREDFPFVDDAVHSQIIASRLARLSESCTRGVLQLESAPEDLDALRAFSLACRFDNLHQHIWRWRIEHHDTCPRPSDLETGSLEVLDPWGHQVTITCDTDGRTSVRSIGQDGIPGTADDVVAR